MRKLVAALFVSLAIPILASDTYIYAPGLDGAIQHWQYPSTVAMNTDFGFYSQDIGKIAFNKGDGIYYYLFDTTPTWVAMGGSGGGSTTFLGLTDTPDLYTGQQGKLVAVNPGASGLEFVAASGGGNVTNVGTPAAEETVVWTDATHIKSVRTIGGGLANQVLTKITDTSYDWGWATPTAGGASVSITATTPIVVTPSPVVGTGVISLDAASDLAAIEALTGTNTIYYRSGSSAWSPVTIGSNLTFVAGTLAASITGGGGGTVTSVSATTPIQVSPNPITGAGTISIEAGSDLGALEALTGTNNIYYRSGVSTWSNVGIGSNLTFVAGSLAAGNANWDTGYSERRQWDGGATNLNATLGRSNLGATTIGANVFTLANPLAISWVKVGTSGTITLEDAATTKTSLGLSTTNWDTAYTDRLKWDTSLGISGSGTTGQGRTALGATTLGSNLFTAANPSATSWMKVGTSGGVSYEDAVTTKTSLGLNNVTNDAQTTAAVMPNTAPTTGQIPIGGVGGAYAPKTISGSGATVTVSSAGVVTIDNVALANIAGYGTAGNYAISNGSAWTSALKPDALNVRVVTTIGTTTYTPTAGVKALFVECVGGGGGGGGVKLAGAGQAASGGGGGGSYAATMIASPGASYSVTVGGGGAGGTATGTNGGVGGTTAFASLASAGGGGGGDGATTAYGPPAWGAAVTSAGADGGVATIGTIARATGSDGLPGLIVGSNVGGSGGGSYFAGTTRGNGGANGAGLAGALYGGGGSGGVANTTTGQVGGAGGQGIIRVWEIF